MINGAAHAGPKVYRKEGNTMGESYRDMIRRAERFETAAIRAAQSDRKVAACMARASRALKAKAREISIADALELKGSF